MQEQVIHQNPAQVLKILILSYLESHPRLTIQALAQRSNVPVTSLRRLLQENEKKDVAPHLVLNITAYILKEKNISKLLKKVPSPLDQVLAENFGAFIFEGHETRFYSNDLNQALTDKTSYLIYKLASNRRGILIQEVINLFGKIGQKKIEELLIKNLITLDSDRLKAVESNFSLDIEVAASHLPELVKFYDTNNITRGLNLMYSLSESLNEEAILQIKEVQKKAIHETLKIMNDENSHGEIPYFTINLCESFYYYSEGVLQ